MATDEISTDAPLGDEDLVRKDRSYSPSSERETEARQAEPRESAATRDDDIDADAVVALPGTGGPDDAGDIRVDADDLNLPRDTGAH